MTTVITFNLVTSNRLFDVEYDGDRGRGRGPARRRRSSSQIARLLIQSSSTKGMSHVEKFEKKSLTQKKRKIAANE